MEYDTPSRFIRDIDQELLDVHSESGGVETSSRKAYNRYDGGAYGTGNTGGYGRNTRGFESESPEWMQNPRPVATQFKADPKPRQVAPRQAEKPVDPFGEGFKRLYQQQTGRQLKPMGAAVRSSQQSREAVQTTPTPPNLGGEGLREGCKIEHQRFGIGTVIKIEGTGENTKATVEFRNTGTKQLLLKFAKFKIIATD